MKFFKTLEEIEVWNDGVKLCVDIYNLTKTKPFEREYSISDQLKRCSLSIPSNIAEGFERFSKKEFIRFLYIAKGSSAELRTQLLVCLKVGLISEGDFSDYEDRCKMISAKISNLIKSLGKN